MNIALLSISHIPEKVHLFVEWVYGKQHSDNQSVFAVVSIHSGYLKFTQKQQNASSKVGNIVRKINTGVMGRKLLNSSRREVSIKYLL